MCPSCLLLEGGAPSIHQTNSWQFPNISMSSWESVYLTEKNWWPLSYCHCFSSELNSLSGYFEIFWKKGRRTWTRIILEMYVSVTWFSGLWAYIFQCGTWDVNSVINSQPSKVVSLIFLACSRWTKYLCWLCSSVFCWWCWMLVDCLLVLVEILSSSFDSYYPFSRSEVHIVSDEQPCEWYFRAENPCAVNCGSARKLYVGTILLTMELS